MKLSLKLEYACQVLSQLGYKEGSGELMHIEDLASAEAVPSNYLVQILNELRTAGLIHSRRGKQGGYAIALAPEAISLDRVVRAVEGEVLLHSTGGKGQSSARVEAIWATVAQRLEGVLQDYTIRDFMRQREEKMWYI
jgi:Rrf2 family cysteine metabolism transcriptional repressor